MRAVRLRGAPARARVAATALALGVAGCAGGGQHRPAPPAGPAARPTLYVAIGASESVGEGTSNPLRQAWPQVFFRSALPPSATFVNLGIRGASVVDADDTEVPLALGMHPDLATVWLNVNDLIRGSPVSTYEASLRDVVHRLRATGTTVLVANTPPLDHLPLYLACSAPGGEPCPAGVPRPLPDPIALNAEVDAYNTAIARVAAGEGAVLADLHAAGLEARAAGNEASLVGADGFHPSAAGAELAARVFAAALRGAPAPPGSNRQR